MVTQLDFFENKTELDLLKDEIKEIKEMSHNVRRGLYKRHSELSKLYLELKEENDQLKIMFLDKFPQKVPDIMVKE